MAYQFLDTRRDGPVEYLTLNRPAVRNAFNDILIEELTAWSTDIAASSRQDVRAVVIAGAGQSFCAGADATWMATTVSRSETENFHDARAMAQMYRALDELPVPVVGRVHGAAIGGGAGLVAVCDVVVADEKTTFGFSEVRLGLVPATISPFVIAKIGPGAARELFLTGRRFSASRAQEIGLVHAVVSEADLDRTVAAYLADLLSAGPTAVALAKMLVRAVPGIAPAEADELTATTIALQRVSQEGQEGLHAFLDKRKPSWTV